MAARKKTAPAAEPAEVEEVQPTTAPESVDEEPLDAVIVVRKDNPRGGLPLYEVILNGRIQPEGVQTALELGLKSWREQIGLVN